MSRLQKLRVVDPVLTNLARGYENASFIGEKLFPVARMSKEGGKIPVFSDDHFKIPETKRAIRADSNRLNPSSRGEIDVVLSEHDIEYPIDYREADEDIFDLQKQASYTTSEIIRLRHEKSCADLAQSTASYKSGNAQALSGTDVFTDAASKPVQAVKDALETVRKSVGKKPNVLWMGASVYEVLSEHAALIEKIKYSQKGIVTPDLMAAIFDVKEVIVGESVYSDADNNFKDLWGDALGACYVNRAKSRSYRDASFGYTLRKKGFPQVDTYDEKGGKLNVVRNTDIFEAKVLGAGAGFLYTNAV